LAQAPIAHLIHHDHGCTWTTWEARRTFPAAFRAFTWK
jgi:hypothetical protein